MMKWLLLGGIKMYQLIIGPLYPSPCRFLPSCSHYTSEAIRLHGAIKGSYLGLKRILRCRPGGGSGYDPVPVAKVKKKI